MAATRLFRPISIALGLFVVLNAGASAARPSLGAARMIVNLPVPEPYLSFSLLAFAVCILFPSRRPFLRSAQLAVLFAVAISTLANIVGFYALIGAGLISTSLPVPFSILILAVVVAEGLALYLRAGRPDLPVAIQSILVPVSLLLLSAGHIVTFGHTDYRGFGSADAAVVLGARVDADWTVSESLKHRLLAAIELWREERAPLLIMTGGTGSSGVNEADAMRRFAEARGVPHAAILCDGEGSTTYASAVNCAAICRDRGLRHVMVVSQYYHLARAKLIFERQGLSVLTVPARVGGQVKVNLASLARETVALPYYYLCCTFQGD